MVLILFFVSSQFSEAGEDVFEGQQATGGPTGGPTPNLEKLARKRMSFLVVHDISDSSPYAILKVPEGATTKDVIKQAVIKGGKYSKQILFSAIVKATDKETDAKKTQREHSHMTSDF